MPQTPLRIALVTNEFVTDTPNGGGLGQYLYRLTLSLRELGHDVEVFSKAEERANVTEFEGIRVESVERNRNLTYRVLTRLGRMKQVLGLSFTRKNVALASALAKAFRHRHRERPFDIVQSGSPGVCGVFIPRLRGLRHVVRLSAIMEQWMRIDGTLEVFHPLDRQLYFYLERRQIRRATRAYAPSRLVSDHYRKTFGLDVEVVRPPACLADVPSTNPPVTLPNKFLFHFGTLSALKGSDVVAAALPLAWKQEPRLTMVWAGREGHGTRIEDFRSSWGDRADQVVYLGALSRPDVYAVLKRAVASVAPSRLDNLPNTAIESLLLGIGVIGTVGSSIDELVEDGVSGELVPIEDAAALADAMVRAWRGEVSWVGAGFKPPAIMGEMRPGQAAQRLIDLALRRSTDAIQHPRRSCESSI